MRRTRPARAQHAAHPARIFDAYRSFPVEYRATKEPTIVDASPATYLAIDGIGDPNAAAFGEAVGALYSVAYSIAMGRKRAGRPSFRVPHLEALWHAKSEAEFMAEPRDAWAWTALLRLPDFVSEKEVADAIDALLAKGRTAAIAEVRRTTLDEGRCVQVLHIGPYDREPDTLARVSSLLDELDLVRHGAHHEIYLSDPRRSAPEKIRTILRHPVRAVKG